MKRRLLVTPAVLSLLLIGAGPLPKVGGPPPPPVPDVDIDDVPDPSGAFPLGVCARAPIVDPRHFCVWVDPE